jgi:predicted transposase YdaD
VPLAVLTQTPDKAQTLRQVAAKVDAIPEIRIHSNIAASAGILAGLLFEKGFINQVLRREIMQQSVIYQEWKEEFLQEGEQRGRIEGRTEEARSLILRQRTCRIGQVSSAMRSQVQALSLVQLESLGEALLDFTSAEDLSDWLRSR